MVAVMMIVVLMIVMMVMVVTTMTEEDAAGGPLTRSQLAIRQQQRGVSVHYRQCQRHDLRGNHEVITAWRPPAPQGHQETSDNASRIDISPGHRLPRA